MKHLVGQVFEAGEFLELLTGFYFLSRSGDIIGTKLF